MSGHFHLRADGKVIELVVEQIRDSAAEDRAFHHHIGISKQQQFTRGTLGADVLSVGLAKPAAGKVGDVHDVQAWIGARHLIENAASLVRGTVVNRDELDIGVILCEHRCQSVLDLAGLVPCGHDYGNSWDGIAGECPDGAETGQ